MKGMEEVSIGTQRIELSDGRKRYQHVAVQEHDDFTFSTLAECRIQHGEEMDWQDCPVASRWTLLRDPKPTGVFRYNEDWTVSELTDKEIALQAIRLLRRFTNHRNIDDCYYSCPAHPDYCGDRDGEGCDCGATKVWVFLEHLRATGYLRGVAW